MNSGFSTIFRISGIFRVLALSAALATSAATFLRADDTLDRGIGSEWSSLNPHVNFDAAAGHIQMDAYEGLTSFDASGRVIPARRQAGMSAPMG